MRMHKPPFELKELKIEVTHRCPLKCHHCSSVADNECARVMTWADCHRIVCEATAMGVEQIAFSGGEPLVWRDLEDAVALASGRKCKVTLYTTGHAEEKTTASRLHKLKDCGLQKTIFSVYSSKPQQHDSMTGVAGSYGQTCKTISESSQIGLTTELHFVPTTQNVQELPAVAALAKSLGATRVSVLRLVPQGRAKSQPGMLLSHEQNLSLRKSILSLRAEGHDIRLGSPYNFLMARDNPACCAAIDRLTVGPDLRIFPCDAFKHIRPSDLDLPDTYGNLGTHSLQECWEKSPIFAAVRTYLTTPFADECGKCSSIEDCTSGCLAQKIIYHGKMCKVHDPMCLKIAEPANFNG